MLTRRSFLHKVALFGAVGAVGSLGGIPRPPKADAGVGFGPP